MLAYKLELGLVCKLGLGPVCKLGLGQVYKQELGLVYKLEVGLVCMLVVLVCTQACMKMVVDDTLDIVLHPHMRRQQHNLEIINNISNKAV